MTHYEKLRHLEGPFGYYDPAPLKYEIARRRQITNGGLTGLSRQLADHYGTNQHSERRLLARVLRSSARLNSATADRLSTFFQVDCDRLERTA